MFGLVSTTISLVVVILEQEWRPDWLNSFGDRNCGLMGYSDSASQNCWLIGLSDIEDWN